MLVLFFTMYRYHNYFELQLFMFITSGYWLTTMNGIRQAMAAAIVTCLYTINYKKKSFGYIV